MMNRSKRLAVILLASVCAILNAASLKEIAAALDMDAALFVKQEYRKYAYDEIGFTIEDENGNPVIQKISNESYWSVQSKTENGTSPYYGKSCLRSNLGSATPSAKTDNTCTRLYLSFFGPGTFSFNYKTQTDTDTLNVYVDGNLSDACFISGYGLDQEWEFAELEIPGGLAPNGTYSHEVVIEFLKSEPSFDVDGKYNKEDGPEKPLKSDYDLTDPSDKEYYEELLAEYNAFVNCIWLDHFQWTPAPVKLAFGQNIDYNTTIIEDYTILFLESNAPDFGYLLTYTMNGTAPTGTSTSYYTIEENGEAADNPITVDKSSVIKAKVFIAPQTPYSPELSLSATITVKASNPQINATQQADGSIKITMRTSYLFAAEDADDENASPCIGPLPDEVVDKNTILYTLDGSDPTTNGKLYDPELGVIITDACIIKAVARRDGVLDSEIVEYTIRQTAPPTVTMFNDQGKTEPYNVYTNSRGMTVKATAPDGTFLQVSLDNGKTYNEFNGIFYLKAAAGQSTATALVRAVSGDLLPSKTVSVTAMAATETWAFGTDTNAEQAIDILPGWNLISFPCYLTLADINAVLEDHIVFAYDPNTRIWSKATMIEPGVVYWLFANTTIATSILRGAPGNVKIPSSDKWECYAPTESQEVPANIIAWEYRNGKFCEATSFVKGRGYIIHKR